MTNNGNGDTKASVFETLEGLIKELESSIRNESDESPAELLASLDRMKGDAYLERAPEAHHVKLLFRHYQTIVTRNRQSGKVNDSSRPETVDPLFYNNFTRSVSSTLNMEGSAEVLVGFEATKTNAFRMRAMVALLSLVAFCVLSFNTYMHAELTPKMLFDGPDCFMLKFEPWRGSFSMVKYQWLIAIAFFVFFTHSLWCYFYTMPTDANNRKYIPGFGDWLDSGISRFGRDPSNIRNARSSVSDFCFTHSKQMEWVLDGVLLFLTTLLCTICSVSVGSGQQFSFADWNETWYSLSTFHETFANTNPPCTTGGNPAVYIEWGLAMMYISGFLQLLLLKLSRDSFLRFQATQGSDGGGGMGDRNGLMPLSSNQDGMQRHGLMADDEDVEVTLS